MGACIRIFSSARYDGLRGRDLDALEDSYRRQQKIDAQAEWNATLGQITRDCQAPDDPQDQYLTVIFDRDDRVQSKSIRTVRDIIYQD